MENKNIYQKIVEVRKNIDGFKKDQKSFGYQYVSGNQILRNIKCLMDDLGLLLIPSLDYSTLEWEKHHYITSKGKEAMDFIVQARMTYTWVNADNPEEKIEVPWVCIGQQADDISKAMGTAMTYNERYFLLKFFGLPTDQDDADARYNRETTKITDTRYNKESIKAAGTRGNKEIIKAAGTRGNKVLSEEQMKKIYAVGKDAGYEDSNIDSMIKQKYNKKTCDMTEEECNNVIEGLQRVAVAKKEAVAKKIVNA